MDIKTKQLKRKRKSIIWLVIICLIIIIGFFGSFCSFQLPFEIFKANKYNSFASSIKLGIDLKGGVYGLYDINEGENMDNISTRLDSTKAALQTMLVNKGYTEALVVREGQTRIRVEVPDVDNPKEIFTLIGQPTTIEFSRDADGKDVFIIGSKHLKKATAFYDTTNGSKPSVRLELNAEGAKILADETKSGSGSFYINQYTGVGDKRTRVDQMNMQFNTSIPNGVAVISSGAGDSWTFAHAKEVADKIMSGTFSVQLKLIQSDIISATLGEKALSLGLIAGIIGILLVIAILCFFYRLYGIMASIALCLYTVLMLFFLAVLPWVQLTLPGIAGIILSIGMAVDANIIIFERIKDEYKNGKSITASTYSGFRRAIIAIVDANITTIIASVMLVIFGTGSIKGFGITLLLGVVVHLFTSLIVSNFLIKNILNINRSNAKLFNLKRKDGSFGIGDSIVNEET